MLIPFILDRENLYNELVEKYPTSSSSDIAKHEREEKNLTRTIYIYGEINYKPYADTLAKVRENSNVFCFRLTKNITS